MKYLFSSATDYSCLLYLLMEHINYILKNPDGNAVQTGAVLTVSDAPAWQIAAGSLGSFSGGDKYWNNYNYSN